MSTQFVAYTDRFIRKGMRLIDCNLNNKVLYLIPVSLLYMDDLQIDGFPAEWQIRDIRLDSKSVNKGYPIEVAKKDQSATLQEKLASRDLSLIKSLVIGCTDWLGL